MRFFGGSRAGNNSSDGSGTNYTMTTTCGEELSAKSPAALGVALSAHQDACAICKPGDEEREFLSKIFDK